MQKGFGLIGILIVVGIIVVLGIGIFKAGYVSRNPFVPTDEEKSAIKQAEEAKNLLEQKNNETVPPDETANWKTYRNEEYGFEVKYPSDWVVAEKKVSNDNPDSWLKVRVSLSNTLNIQDQKLNKENMDTISAFQITFRGSANEPQLDIEKWYEVSPEGNDEIISKAVATIGGRKAVCTDTSWRDFIIQRCFVPNGTSIIEIGYSPSQSKFIDDYENILSTFRFIK